MEMDKMQDRVKDEQRKCEALEAKNRKLQEMVDFNSWDIDEIVVSVEGIWWEVPPGIYCGHRDRGELGVIVGGLEKVLMKDGVWSDGVIMDGRLWMRIGCWIVKGMHGGC